MKIQASRPTIIFFTTSFRNCGPNQQLLNLVRYAHAQRVRIVVLALHEGKDELKKSFCQSGAEVTVLIRKWSDVFSVFFRLHILTKKLQPIAIQSHGLAPDLLLNILPFSLPKYATVRNSPFQDYQQKYGRVFGGVLARVHILSLRRIGRVISCSSHIQGEIKKYGINSVVIRNGVDVARIRGLARNQGSRAKRTVGDIRFITASSLLPRKNIELLFNCFSRTPLDFRAQLTTFGDGPLMQYCKTIASPNIELRGHVSNPSEYFRSGDVFISLSNSEGMPNSVLEALVAGVPCILSDIPPHREVFQLMAGSVRLVKLSENEESLAAEIFSLAEELLANPALRIRDEALEHFSSSATSRGYLKAYGVALGGSQLRQ